MSSLSTRTTIENRPVIEWRRIAFDAIRIVLGILLLFAAGLKLYGWSVSTVPPLGWFSTPSVQATAVGWEIFLGAWLLSAIASTRFVDGGYQHLHIARLHQWLSRLDRASEVRLFWRD